MALKEVSAIVQARMGSIRFPGKVLSKINGVPLIEILIQRLKKSKNLKHIIVATSNDPNNKKLIQWCKKNKINFFIGNEEDVLKRFYDCATKYKIKNILRITADCPLSDPEMIDEAIKIYSKKKLDYLSNTNPPTYPDGFDLEIFNYKALTIALNNTVLSNDREHVTPFIIRKFKDSSLNIRNTKNLSNYRLTVDEVEDYKLIKKLFNYFNNDIGVSFLQISNLINDDNNFFTGNKHLTRNIGQTMSTGQKLYKRAKKIIPGGNMLLSKRPEMFLPNIWPSYYSKAIGCHIWSLDNIKYTDMSIMGIGTNILGYARKEVDEAVIANIKNGNMSSLNCPEEVYLAEKLIEIHPWANQVKFARAGGEALAIAVRISRSYSKKDEVAICGYHGWHDWYLSANLANKKNLNNHLLNDLNPIGIPECLKNTSHSFQYNDIESLEKIISERSIGTVVMEVSRGIKPKNNFLQNVRDLTRKNNIVLVFDECTSGFRETYGGIHTKYEVNPDICMLGKALGNGYAITAIIGINEVMKEAQSSFISSTFWSERSGPTAALKTLEIMKKEKSWISITNIGKSIKLKLKKIADKYDLNIDISGLDPLINFKFLYDDWQKYKTYITQEMLKKNYLASNLIYVSTVHNEDIIDEYINHMSEIFKKIREFEDGLDVNKYIDNEISHEGFQKLIS